MGKRTTVRKKLVPKVRVTTRIRPELIEMLRLGAAYHKVGYQTYLQWLVEDALKKDAKYYGWEMLPKKYKVQPGLTADQQREVRRLVRISKRRVPE